MSATEQGGLCLVCDVSVESFPVEEPYDRRCMDCRLRGRTASWRLRFTLGKVPHRTDWCDDFRCVESRHDVENVGVSYVQIDGAEHLDPPNPQPPDRPRRRTADTDLSDY